MNHVKGIPPVFMLVSGPLLFPYNRGEDLGVIL